MKYEPVKIRTIVAVEYVPSTKPWHQFAVGVSDGHGGTFPGSTRSKDGTPMVATGRTKRYFVVSSKLFGECGHKHKTEAAAEPCKRKMKQRWTARRSKQMRGIYRAGVAKRKTPILTSMSANREIL